MSLSLPQGIQPSTTHCTERTQASVKPLKDSTCLCYHHMLNPSVCEVDKRYVEHTAHNELSQCCSWAVTRCAYGFGKYI